MEDGSVITRKEMADYLTPEFWQAGKIWQDYKRFGLHHGQGTAGENSETIDLLTAFDNTYEAATSEARSS